MNIEEFRTAVAASQEHGKWHLLPEKVPDGIIENIEKRLRVRFPDCYRSVMSEFGCGQFHYVELLTFDSEDEEGVLKSTRRLRKCGVKDFVAIASNGCGDYYGFISPNGVCSEAVYFLDHETEEISPEPIAESFLIFLRNEALVLSTDLHLLATGRGHLVKKWWWW